MSTKLFVGGLPWAMDTQRLKEVFAEFGDLVDARVITDRETGRSRGFGFVTFGSPEGAERAIALDGQEVDGRRIRVDRAQEKERPSGGRPPGPGGGPPRAPRPEGEGGGPPRSFDGPPRPPGSSPGKPKAGRDRDRGGGGGGGEGGGDDYRRKPDKAGRGRRKGGRGGRGGGGEGGGDFDDYDY
jgi:RNA recognition motif-containing protein